MRSKGYESLGDNVVPVNYELLFEPDLKRFITNGAAKIRCVTNSPTNEIRLNAKELEIKTAYVRCGNARQKAEVKMYEDKQQMALVLEQPASGDTEIELTFTCQNNNRLYGFYRSKYSVNGQERYMLTTQFEAADARAAFPCFDEPGFRATFNVSMLIDTNLDAISNMPIKHESVSLGKKLVVFEPTPRMSSYLLYLGVGEFEYLTDKVGDVKIRVITTPGKKEFAELPLEYAKKSFEWLQDYFGVKYPLPKIDYIAVPDFAVGAMENWGAIAYREFALLGKKDASLVDKQYKAIVIAHETAHQWFGDLVTMKWWDDIWLNESFATFMSFKTVDAIFPKWKMSLQCLEDERDAVAASFAADALKNTHPINIKIYSVGDIDAAFDRISYGKGGAVLRMLEGYVGKEAFRKGLYNYLTKNSYSNVKKEDFFKAIADAASSGSKNREIMETMQKWVSKAGYPIISISKERKVFALKQQRFTLSGNIKDKWPIPVRYLSPKKEAHFLMTQENQKLNEKGEWVKLNYGQEGFYRAMYESQMLKEIGTLIKKKKISGLDAWGVQNDLFALARSSRMPVKEYLNFIEEYCMDVGYPANSGIASRLVALYTFSQGKEFSKDVKSTTEKFSKNILKKVGWDTKDEADPTKVIVRNKALINLGLIGDSITIGRAKKRFEDYAKHGKEISDDIKKEVYALAALSGDKSVLPFLIKRYKEDLTPDEQRRVVEALGYFNKADLIKGSLEFSKSKEMKLGDSFVTPSIISSMPLGKDFVWPWVKANWKEFKEKYEPGTHILSKFIDMLSMVSSPSTKRDIEKFFKHKGNMRGDVKSSLNTTLELIEANIKLVQKNK